MTGYVAPESRFQISTGEALWTMPDNELTELHENSGKLLSRIGRSSHYRRKNRTNIQCLEDDRRLIALERARRRGLLRLRLCGIDWRYSAAHRYPLPEGGESDVYVFVRQGPDRWGCIRPQRFQELTLLANELKNAQSAGAVLVRDIDPLNVSSITEVFVDGMPSPWLVIDVEEKVWREEDL